MIEGKYFHISKEVTFIRLVILFFTSICLSYNYNSRHNSF